MRIIAAVRLSRTDEQTASPEAQAESLREYAQRNGHVIVKETSDLDVSGGKPIRQRPDIGKMLTPEHLDEWDAIAGYAIDRMFRNLYDFVTFYNDFLLPNGKGLIITSENIDMSTPDGVTMAQMRVIFAENELNKIRARNKRSQDYFRKQGLWHGGKVPFGYAPKRHGSHFVLVPHEDHAAIVREAARDIITGKSLSQMARELTARKIPTGWSRKKNVSSKWSATALARLLRNKALLGYVPYNFRKDGSYDLATNEDGAILRREPILDNQTWTELQDALMRPEQRGNRRFDASMLLGIAYCGNCNAKLWLNRFTSRGQAYAYYVCSAECGVKGIPASELESAVSAMMTEDETLIVERRVIAGSNRQGELEAVQEAQANLIAIQDEIPEDEFDEQMSKLRKERKRILALPDEPNRTISFQTGETYASRWHGLQSDQERRAMLLGQEVTVSAVRGSVEVKRPERAATGMLSVQA